MNQLLIVDDEPLVQAGIKSMLDWRKYDINICGTAANGKQAFELIEQFQPEIVLSDIKMPIMTGLELLKKCRATYENLPIFIFLTSYDDFALVQEALKYQALDYLIKLDITPQVLSESIRNALKQVYYYKKEPTNTSTFVHQFYERFMMRLLNGLINDEKQLYIQAKELNLTFNALSYGVIHCQIIDFVKADLSRDKRLNLYNSTIHMVKSLMNKHMLSYVTSLDMERFCILVHYDIEDVDMQMHQTKKALEASLSMINNYFNIQISASVGRSMSSPLQISDAYQDARQIHTLCTKENPIVFYNSQSDPALLKNTTFHLGIFKNDIQLAFESFDSKYLENTIDRLIELFEGHPKMFLQAMDVASNILYITLSMLPDSSNALNETFKNYPEKYRCLYGFSRTDQVVSWLILFKTSITDLLQTQHKSFKNHMILSVRDYIDDHIHNKLSLNDIAMLFNISPNYLSVLFKKTIGVGFNEYITHKKIALAKNMLTEDAMRVYEVAEALGFENAFYFSKVFKKVVGQSPSSYVNEKA